ncbi:MAG: VanZ family protein [Verrucomicrobiota bacterium]
MTRKRLWILVALFCLCILVLSSVPEKIVYSCFAKLPDIPHKDKIAHVAEYGTLGLLLRSVSLPFFKAFGFGAAIGGIDELYQYFIPDREPSLGDWATDLLGLIIGLLIGHRKKNAGVE